MRLDSTSTSYDAEPYVTVLARRLHRARRILSEPDAGRPPSGHSMKNQHGWARSVQHSRAERAQHVQVQRGFPHYPGA